MSLFDLLVDQAKERIFTDDEIRNMSKEFRRYVASANGGAIAMPQGMLDLLNGRKITKADKEAATRISTEVQIKITSHYRPEAFLNTTGGFIHYTPDTVDLQSLNGTVQKRNNSVIPAPFGVAEKHPNVQALAAAVAQLVVVDSGEWKGNVQVNSWTKILPRDGGMDAAGMVGVADTACTILNNTRNWKGMDLITRNACTGLEALSYIRSELDNLSSDEYLYLNTKMVFGMLRPFEKDEDIWYERTREDDTLCVSPSSYIRTDPSPKLSAQLTKEGYPAAYLYIGGYAPKLNNCANSGRMRETLARYQQMMEIQVGNNSSTAILSQMRGYSGLTDDFGKRIQFLSAAALGAWQRGKAVDIQLKTTGDTVMLVSTLNKWVDRYKQLHSLIPVDVNGKRPVFPLSIGDFKLIIPKPTDMSKIPTLVKTYCVYAPRANTCIIVYNDVALPTSGEKGAQVNYAECAQDLVPDIWRNNQLIAYMPIYDNVFWPKGKTDDVSLTSQKEKNHYENYSVYQFGSAAMFRGVVSTFSNLELVGWGYRKMGGKWDRTQPETFVPIELEKAKDFSDWLVRVGTDCSIQMLSWLRPVSRYSPISNLPYISKKGVTIVLTQVDGEDGGLIGNVARVETSSVKRGRAIGSSVPVVPKLVAVAVAHNAAVPLVPPLQPPAPAKRRRIIQPDQAREEDESDEELKEDKKKKDRKRRAKHEEKQESASDSSEEHQDDKKDNEGRVEEDVQDETI